MRQRDQGGRQVAARLASGRPRASVISSTDNARVKRVAELRSSRERRRRGLFVAEGRREVERALAAGLVAAELYHAPALLDWPGAVAVSERVLAKMTYRAKPEGVVAVFEAPRRALPRDGSLYLVSVGVEKPGNLGALARSAEAAGAEALLVAEGQADPFNPNAIRASTGAVFTLPVLETTLEQVAALGVALVAAVVAAPLRYSDADLTRPVAFAVGAEDRGLPPRWREAAELSVSIPLRPGATSESLNVAVAASLLLFEAVRQRG